MDYADVIDAIKDRMQLQQQVVEARNSSPHPLTHGDVLALRAELDALWAAIAALTQAHLGIPASHAKIHDYFAESGYISPE